MHWRTRCAMQHPLAKRKQFITVILPTPMRVGRFVEDGCTSGMHGEDADLILLNRRQYVRITFGAFRTSPFFARSSV